MTALDRPQARFASFFRPSDAQVAALDLVNEMCAERRISTTETLVLLAALVDGPAVLSGLALETVSVLRPQAGGAKASSKAETRS